MIDWVGLAVSFLFDLCKWRLEVHLTGKSFFFHRAEVDGNGAKGL